MGAQTSQPLKNNRSPRPPNPREEAAAKRQSHRAAMASKAHEELRTRLKKMMPAAAGSILRACAFADKGRTGHVHRAELKVVLDTYLFPLPSDQYLRLVKAFEPAGDGTRVNYKALVAHYRAGGHA